MVLVENPAQGSRGLTLMEEHRRDGNPSVAGNIHWAGAESLELFTAAALAASDENKCLVAVPLDHSDEVEAELAASLSRAERQRAARFRRPRDRRHYVVAHARLRQLLAQRLDLRPEQVALGCNRYGKPELLGPQAASGWRFNLSYSDGTGGGLALCALSRRGRIGVDVESVRELDDAETLAQHFFSPREYAMYRQLAPDDRPLGFFRCWTGKEAFVKALGTGLSLALDEFDVALAPGMPARLLRVGCLGGERCGWGLENIGPAGGRLATVVTERS